METIVCPTDFTACSENAIRYSGFLAQHLNARIMLFHNVYAPIMAELTPHEVVPYVEVLQDPEYRQEQQNKLDGLIQELQNQNPAVPPSVDTKIKYGHTLTNLVQLAREEKADLIVLGHAGFQEGFEESFTASIIQEAPCPVLIVPPHVAFAPPRKIVFATDLKGESFTDVSQVCQLTSLFNAELQLLHILKDDTPTRRQKAEAGLALLQKRLPCPQVTSHLKVNADLNEGIHRFCFQQQADLLVVGCRDKNFWQQLFQHDNTREIAAQTFLPLLVIHHRQ